MRQKRAARKRAIRGLVLSASIAAFVPAFLLVSGQPETEDGVAAAAPTQAAVASSTPSPVRPSTSSAVPAAPRVAPAPAASQSGPQTVAPRARTRAS